MITKRLIITLFLISVLLSSCTSNSKPSNAKLQEEQNNITLDISEKGIFLNSKKIDLNTELTEIKEVIGNPSKEKIQSPSEIQNTKVKFGSIPNNIFTWNKYGLMIYQKADKKTLNSISIDFKLEDFGFSPSSVFTGQLRLNGVLIDKTTSIDDLKNTSGLDINESIYKAHTATFNNHDLTFEFKNNQDKSGLVGFSIDIDNTPVRTNAKGWTDSQIETLKASGEYFEQIKALSEKHNFIISEYVDCYAEKISNNFTMKDLENLTPDTQLKIGEIMDDCIIETSRN